MELPLVKITLGELGVELFSFQEIKDYTEMTFVIILRARIDENVIDEDDDELVKIWAANTIHEIHEHCRRIS